MNKNWVYKEIGEVMSVERGGSPRPINKYLTDSEDGLNWIKISDATASDKYIFETKQRITKDGLKKTRLVNEGDFLLSNSMSFGRPYIMKTTGCIHDGWLVLKEKEKDVLNKDFLYHLLGSPYIFDQFDKLAAGSTVRNLNIGLVSSVEIPIPSLSEQEAVVSILDQAFAAIDQAKANIEKNIENAKELFQSKLNEIFSQKGEGWEEKALGEACVISMGQSPKGTSYNSEGIGMPLINGPVEFGPNPFSQTVMTKWTTEPTKTCKEGDLILCVRGSTTGRINIAGFEACIGRGVASIRYSKNQKWLNFFIRHYQKSIYDLGTGSTFPNVSGKILSEIIFPEPDSETQNRLVGIMKELNEKNEELIQKYNRKYELLEDLKKSFLQKAFAGELTQKDLVI